MTKTLNFLKTFFAKNNKIIKIILFFVFPVLLVLAVELVQKQSFSGLLEFITGSSRAFLFSYFIVFIVFYMLYLLISRHAFYASFIFFVILAIVNLLKRQILGEPLYLTDIIAQAGQSGDIASFVHFKISIGVVLFFLFIFLVNFAYFRFFQDFKIRKIIVRLPLFIVFFMLFYFVIVTNDFREKYLLKTIGYDLDGVNWRQNYNYDANGFITAFYINISNAYVKKPEGYNKEAIDKIVENIKNNKKETIVSENSADDKPDFIFILSEAFFDLSRIKGIDFGEDLTPNLHRLQTQTYHGKMISPTFGGKTALVEFELMTGDLIKNLPVGSIPYTQYVNRDIPAIGWIFKANGYKTLALHTYDKTFFNRNNAYPHIGIDNFYGEDSIKNPKYKGPFISDDTFVDELTKHLDSDDKNKFIMGITMQNHFSYENKYKKSEISVKLKNNFSPKVADILTNYAQGIHDADASLGKLLEYLKTREKHTVVLFFGDHLPNLGDNNIGYTETKYINEREEKKWNKDNLENMYSPDFVIWSNKGEFENKDLGYIGASYLGNYVLDAEMIKSKGTYFDYISEEFKCLQANSPVLSFTKETGVIRNKDRKTCLEYDKNHALLQYDTLFGKNYLTKYYK
ncbi:MAG: LTA synthase family protein [Candidatus Gracilibacteria bacterium]|nr:LTA synthase family protein [Candidatus Gracilibacteria bacterium]